MTNRVVIGKSKLSGGRKNVDWHGKKGKVCCYQYPGSY